jgi:tripartite ATP-independent transporter DctP family solute receptor
MFKKTFTVIFVIFFQIVFLGTAFSAEQIAWKLGGVHAVTTPETKGLNYFADLIKEKSDGDFIINIYPAGQLGKKAVTLIENLMMGSIEMFGNVMDWNQHLVKDFGILAMPFTFKSLEGIKTFQQGEIYENMKKRIIEEKGVRIVSDNWYRLPKVLLAKRPIKTLEDLQGLNIRMPSLKTYFETWKGLGAKPTTIAWSEAYLALKKGVVDGLDSPMGSIYGMKFYQAAPNIMLTYHLIAPFNLLVNEKKYQQLPDKYKNILIEAGKQAGDYYTKLVVNSFKVDKEKMIKSGCKFIEIDTAPFAKAAVPIAEKFEADGMWEKGLFKKITETY